MTSDAKKKARPAQALGAAPARGSARPGVFEVTESEHPDFPVGSLMTLPRSRGSRRRRMAFASPDLTPRMLCLTVEFRRVATDGEWFAHNEARGYPPPTPKPATRRKP